MKIALELDKITLDDLIMFEEIGSNQIPARKLRSFIARFIVMDDDRRPSDEEAITLAGQLTIAELRGAFDQIGEQIGRLQATAVPPEINGG